MGGTAAGRPRCHPAPGSAGPRPGPGVVGRSAVAIEAVALPADWSTLQQVAADQAHHRRGGGHPGETEHEPAGGTVRGGRRGRRWWPPARERLACSAARLALIRADEVRRHRVGLGQARESARIPVGSCSGVPGGLRGVVTVLRDVPSGWYGGLGARDAASRATGRTSWRPLRFLGPRCRASPRRGAGKAEQLGQRLPAPEAPRLDVPSATPSTWAASATRHAVHVDEDERHPLPLGQLVQGLAHVEPRPRPTAWWSCRSGRSELAEVAGPARPWTFSRRSRSRHALTTIRCSHVVTAASPRNASARRKAAMNASCTASAASSGSTAVRSATAYIRSRWRRNSSPNASPPSPSTWRASSSRSGSSLRSSASRDHGLSRCDDLVEPGAALAVVVGARLGEPDDDVLALRRPGRRSVTVPSASAFSPIFGGALEAVVGADVDLTSRVWLPSSSDRLGLPVSAAEVDA